MCVCRTQVWRRRASGLWRTNSAPRPRTCRTSFPAGAAAASQRADPRGGSPTTCWPPWSTSSQPPRACSPGWTGNVFSPPTLFLWDALCFSVWLSRLWHDKMSSVRKDRLQEQIITGRNHRLRSETRDTKTSRWSDTELFQSYQNRLTELLLVFLYSEMGH